MLPKATLKFIGSHTNYDHASVLHCIKSINNLLETDKETQSDVTCLQQMLQVENDAKRLNGKLEEEYYYVSLDECNSVKVNSTQSIVFSGYTEQQIAEILIKINPDLKTVKHNKTGLFILEYIKKEEE
jgi:hypothetical protein